MATNEQIKKLLRGVVKKQESCLASSTNAGLMSAADKIKLDNIQVDFDSGTLSILTPRGVMAFAAIKGSSQ